MENFEYDPEKALWKPGRRSFIFMLGTATAGILMPSIVGSNPQLAFVAGEDLMAGDIIALVGTKWFRANGQYGNHEILGFAEHNILTREPVGPECSNPRFVPLKEPVYKSLVTRRYQRLQGSFPSDL